MTNTTATTAPLPFKVSQVLVVPVPGPEFEIVHLVKGATEPIHVGWATTRDAGEKVAAAYVADLNAAILAEFAAMRQEAPMAA